jgi:hypothetical protein
MGFVVLGGKMSFGGKRVGWQAENEVFSREVGFWVTNGVRN